MKRSVIGAVKLPPPNHLGPGLTPAPSPCLHALPCSSAYNEKKVNICIFLHSNIKKFIKSTYKNLDKRPLSLRSSQASDFSSRIFRAQIYQAFVTPHNCCEFSEHFCDLSYRPLVSNRNPSSIHNKSSEATLKPPQIYTAVMNFQSTQFLPSKLL